MARNEIRCSFCGKTESQVLKLLKGPNGPGSNAVCVGDHALFECGLQKMGGADKH